MEFKLNHVSITAPRLLLYNSLTSASEPHCRDVIMGSMAFQITSLTIVYSTVYAGVDQRNHKGSAPLAFVSGIHRWPVNSPHKWPVTRKMLPFDDVIMRKCLINGTKQVYIIRKQYRFQYFACLRQNILYKPHKKAITISSVVHPWSGYNRKHVYMDDLI